jgi:Fungal specific transcription factor domain
MAKKGGVLLSRYRYVLEQALAQAGWMTTQALVVLQAVILLIVSVYTLVPLIVPECPTRRTQVMGGTTLGIAQAMGMHHDSESFSLSPAEIEVRRRVWRTLCLLDNRISEDCGGETRVPTTMDTKLPLHIND